MKDIAELTLPKTISLSTKGRTVTLTPQEFKEVTRFIDGMLDNYELNQMSRQLFNHLWDNGYAPSVWKKNIQKSTFPGYAKAAIKVAIGTEISLKQLPVAIVTLIEEHYTKPADLEVPIVLTQQELDDIHKARLQTQP